MAMAGRGPRVMALAGLAVAALFVAAACGGSTVTPETVYVTPTPGATPLPPGVTPEPTPGPPVISTFLVESSAPDGRWKVTFKKPVVSGISEAAATKINNTITDKVNAFIAAFNGTELPAVAAGAGPSTLQGDYSIGINSRNVVSLRFTIVTYVSGAAHPSGAPGSLTVAVGTGDTVALESLFSDKVAALAKITGKCKSELTTLLGADLTWDGKVSSFGFYDKAWVITASGLEFNFAQGAMASQAAGQPSATVPWSDIKSVVDSKGVAGGFIS
jgi:hypothetical protein